LTGYAHPRYAASLKEFGTPRPLPRSGGWLLERAIDGTALRDAMGCYPLFACADWSQLHLDLEDSTDGLVSLSAVTDPFGDYTEDYLRRCFPDVVLPFKEHFVTELGAKPLPAFVSKHHRYYARKASEQVRVERCDNPAQFVDEWTTLYGALVERHALKGIKAFSRRSFAAQLDVPGIVMFRAVAADTTVGAHLWYVQNDVAYSHLAASNALGYELMAAYALYWFALEYFAEQRIGWLDVGAGAGLGGDDAGLTRFKRGWSTASRTVYFCGRIFDRQKYAEATQAKGVVAADTRYFPAYRQGEFG
jgi:hypothetical protein